MTVEHQGWVAWFARNPVAANLLMIIILIAGGLSARQLNTEGFPGLAPEDVTISVEYLSGAASAAEEGVTMKIEDALQGIQGIDRISSLSSASGSEVVVTRTSGYDLDRLFRDIRTRMTTLSTLPPGAEQPLVEQEERVSSAIRVHVYGNVDQDVLQQAARQLREKLLDHPAVGWIDTRGAQTPEINIEVDEQQLQALGLSFTDITTRMADASLIEARGELFGTDGQRVIKADRQRYQQREFEQIVLRQNADGSRLTLADISRVRDDFAPSAVLSRFNGQPAIWLDVRRYNNRSDVAEVAAAVKAGVARFNTSLPEGIQAIAWDDKSEFISNRLALLIKNLLLGIALVMLVLSLFLNLRLALWVGAGLPVICAGALALMGPWAFNISLNELTTFGFILVLGIVVDDAVVVGESIYSEQQQRGAGLDATVRGAQRVTMPTLFGVLTTLAAFGSLFLIKGNTGQVFTYFASAAMLCLLFSMLESKLILPAHLSHLNTCTHAPRNLPEKLWAALQGRLAAGLLWLIQHAYRPLLKRLIAMRYATLLVLIAGFILVVGMVPSGQIRMVFFPNIPDEFVAVELTLEEQAGYGLLQQQALQIEQAAWRANDVLMAEHTLTTAPIAELMTLTGPDGAQLAAGLSPGATRSVDANAIADQWRAEIGALEGVQQLRFLTSWQRAPDIEIELRSPSTETLQAASAELQQALATYQGVSDIQNSLKAGQYQIELVLRPAGEALGLTIGELARQIDYAYRGTEVRRIQRGPDELRVKVRYPEHQRAALDGLRGAQVRTPDGQVVALSTVARLESRYIAAEIERLDRQRVAVISASVDRKQVTPTEITGALQAESLARLQASYRDLSVNIGGLAEQQAEITDSMYVAFGVALLAIYMLLAIPLRSYSQPLLIMLAIPFGITGALLGHWLHGIELSVLSIFGILALSGVVVNDSLLLVTRYNENKATGMAVHPALVDAGCSRMRAVLLTSLTTYIGLVPLIQETANNALFLIPAALAMGYGILLATVVTLVLVPVLLMIADDLQQLWQRPGASPAVESTQEERHEHHHTIN